MEYVIFKGKDVLFTLDGFELNQFRGSQFRGRPSGNHKAIYLPGDPCDLELFRDTLHEVLTEIINKKRQRT